MLALSLRLASAGRKNACSTVVPWTLRVAVAAGLVHPCVPPARAAVAVLKLAQLAARAIKNFPEAVFLPRAHEGDARVAQERIVDQVFDPAVVPAIRAGLLREQLVEESRLLVAEFAICLLYTSPSPRDATLSRMPSSA